MLQRLERNTEAGSGAVRGQPIGRLTHLRLRPPRLALGAELQWVLRRAFGPISWTAPSLPSASRAVDNALRLDVASRIAARHPRGLLQLELGNEAAQRLHEQYIGTIGRAALLDHVLEELLEVAASTSVPCVLLKYAALNRMGVLPIGSRVATDLDVLVPRTHARQFQAKLQESGFRDLGLLASGHQLPALQHGSGVLIELHVHVPLVSLAPGGEFVSAEDLMAAGLATPSGKALLPGHAILAAHAMCHGLLQHANAPHMYSPLKTFADLVDIQAASPSVLEQVAVYLSAAMTSSDIGDVQTLVCALVTGDLEKAAHGGPGIILRHALASQLDRAYAIRLRLGALIRGRSIWARLRQPQRLYAAARDAWTWARAASPRPPS